MAERMSPQPLPHWEKSGNVTWVECPDCHGWLPVDAKMVDPGAPRMICFRCAREFAAAEAARII